MGNFHPRENLIDFPCSHKLLLSIKEGFKVLNPFFFRWNHKQMFFTWHRLQILRAIIRLNTIKMVNNPAIRKTSIMSFFPNKNMLKNIMVFTSSWVLRLPLHHITIRSKMFPPFTWIPLWPFKFSFHTGITARTTAFRVRHTLAMWCYLFTTINTIITWLITPSFIRTWPASKRIIISTKKFATIYAIYIRQSSYSFISTLTTISRFWTNELMTIRTRFFMTLNISFIYFSPSHLHDI